MQQLAPGPELAARLSLSEPGWLRERRQQAATQFLLSPMPAFRYGLNIALNPDGLDLGLVRPAPEALPRPKQQSGITILPLEEAAARHPEAARLLHSTAHEEDKLSLLHLACFTGGWLVHIPPGVAAQEPVLLNLPMTQPCSLQSVLVVAEPGSSATIIERSSGNGYFSSLRTEVFAGDGSRVRYLAVQDRGPDVFQFATRRGVAGRDAAIDWFTAEFGGRLVRSEMETVLQGRGSSSANHGVFFGSGRQQHDLFLSAVHAAPDTTSNLLTKGALAGSALSVYRGLVKIRKEAGRSNGYQKEDTLLLSPDARADAVPYLEIDNNDVRCGHSSTTGHVDREKLFYLTSRGLDSDAASRIIAQGFFEPVLGRLPELAIADEIRAMIARRLEA